MTDYSIEIAVEETWLADGCKTAYLPLTDAVEQGLKPTVYRELSIYDLLPYIDWDGVSCDATDSHSVALAVAYCLHHEAKGKLLCFNDDQMARVFDVTISR